MKPIHPNRQRIEAEGRHHAVKHGLMWPLHFENLPFLVRVLDMFLTLTMLKSAGMRHALALACEEVTMVLDDLPRAFDGLRILFLADLHVDGNPPLADRIIDAVESLTYDICLLGGDYNFATNKESDVAFSRMVKIATFLANKSPVYGILGNHDRYSMAECLAGCHVTMLINDSVCLRRGGDALYLVGLDDSHYFQADDIEAAEAAVPLSAFKLILSHSPERYEQAVKAGCRLYLAGHTHGGQVCLPGGLALVTCTTIPRRMLKGKWSSHDMQGYTTRGVGTSGVPVRFRCPPEITLMTLTR